MAQAGGDAAAAAVSGQENGSCAEVDGAVAAFSSVKLQVDVPAPRAEEAVHFYKAAFAAEEMRRMNHPKRKAEQETPLLLCAELQIGSSSLLVCARGDEYSSSAPKAAGSGVVLVLETEDVRAAVSKAVNAGAALEGELGEGEGPCCGGVSGMLRDPFGLVWLVTSASKSCAAS